MTRENLSRKIMFIMRIISAQFPENPESKLMLGIVKQSAADLMSKDYRMSAERYLKNAVHAEMCGINPVWIHETFDKFGIFDDAENFAKCVTIIPAAKKLRKVQPPKPVQGRKLLPGR